MSFRWKLSEELHFETSHIAIKRRLCMKIECKVYYCFPLLLLSVQNQLNQQLTVQMNTSLIKFLCQSRVPLLFQVTSLYETEKKINV